MTRWMHPPEFERPRQQDQFDPLLEGDRYGLSRELALAIWKWACADATDSAGRRDEEKVRQRFDKLAARIAARGGRLRPDPGRVTRVGVEISGDSLGAWSVDELKPRTPGRETLVAVEARRWMVQGEGPTVCEGPTAGEPSRADEASTMTSKDAGGAKKRREQPGTSEVAQAIAALQGPPRPDRTRQFDAWDGERISRLFASRRTWIAEIPDTSAMTALMKGGTKNDEVHSAQPPVSRRTGWHDWLPDYLLSSSRGGAFLPTVKRVSTIFRSQVAPVEEGAAEDPAVAEALCRRGGGEPLPEALRGEMEATLGTDCRHRRPRVPVPPGSPGTRDPPGGARTVLRLARSAARRARTRLRLTKVTGISRRRGSWSPQVECFGCR